MKKLKQIATEAEYEAYQYFHDNIRPLPKTKDGHWNFKTGLFVNNDVDAFRHAYVSGRFTHVFDNRTADILGQLKELEGDIKRNQSPEEKNMDLWNNQVGRTYGDSTTSKQKLALFIQQALTNGELIITIDQKEDARIYQKSNESYDIDPNKPIVVLEESETGRNEWFLDLVKKSSLSRRHFVQDITNGLYPGYSIADINDIPTPVSKPDKHLSNNLN
jgi:hypothetical protein